MYITLLVNVNKLKVQNYICFLDLKKKSNKYKNKYELYFSI